MSKKDGMPRDKRLAFKRNLKRGFHLFLVLMILISSLPTSAFAAWDGVSDSTSGSSSTVGSDCALIGTSTASTIIGYRFSVYSPEDNDGDGFGDKLGHSIDIDFTDQVWSASGYYQPITYGSYKPARSTGKGKLSHVDLYRKYLEFYDDGSWEGLEPTVDTLGTLAVESADGVYVHKAENVETLYPGEITMLETQADPALMEKWLDDVRSKYLAADLCGAGDDYDEGESYIVVEPLFYIKVEGTRYVLTMAELAVYQAAAISLMVSMIKTVNCMM